MSLKAFFRQVYHQLVVSLATQQSPLLSYYFKHIWTPKAGTSESFIDAFAKKNKDQPFVFLQIGANNGYQHDPMFKFIQRYPHWLGILVEPQKKVFETQLKTMYQHYSQLTLINAAIAPQNGTMPLYKIAFSEARWATGLASFDPKSIERHIHSGYIQQQSLKQGITLPIDQADYITTEAVNCISFDTIIAENGLQKIDLLLIDTEGFDFEVIKMIDFRVLKPRLIVYEHIHLSEQDKNNCTQHLEMQDYTSHSCGRDVAAITS